MSHHVGGIWHSFWAGIGDQDTNFFFQAEDGIRDKLVTGVQTCALPISPVRQSPAGRHRGTGAPLEQRRPQGGVVVRAAGRRGRRQSAYEAPREAVDRGTRLGGAESKRRRCPPSPQGSKLGNV